MKGTRLQAISMGYKVEIGMSAPQTLRVHSRFRHALNLTAPGVGPLTLLGGESSDFPTGIRLALPDQWDWRREVDDGAPVVARAGLLVAAGWQVDLAGCPTWQPRTLCVPLRIAAVRRLSLLHDGIALRLRLHAMTHGAFGHVQLLPRWPASARAVTLAPGDDPLTLQHEVRDLIGYGAGLTPDGDDYLLGYLAALWPWRGDPVVGAHRFAVARAVERNLGRTTDLSGHFLRLAVQGHFSEPIEGLLRAFAGHVAEVAVRPLADALLRFGATSGADILAGMLHGIRALQRFAGMARMALPPANETGRTRVAHHALWPDVRQLQNTQESS